jgi:hypothetical protein
LIPSLPGFIARAGPAPVIWIVGSERSSANHILDHMAQLGKARGPVTIRDEVLRHGSANGIDVGLS